MRSGTMCSQSVRHSVSSISAGGSAVYVTFARLFALLTRKRLVFRKLFVPLQPKGCETAHARQSMQASLLSLNRSFVTRYNTLIHIY